MNTTPVHVDRWFSGITATVFGLFPALVWAQGGGYMRGGMDGDCGGMGHMMGGMWLMGLIGILVIVVLGLSAAALIKYLFKK